MSEMVLVRGDRSGVFYGELLWRKGTEARILNARRIWYWAGAASLSQLAVDGTAEPNNCKFPKAVPWVELTDVIEVLPVSDKARKSIEAVKIWRI